MNPLTKRIEEILEQTFGGFVLDGGMRERKASKLITTLFKEELEALAEEVEGMKTPALFGKEGDEEKCCNCGEDLSLETYDWFDKGYELASADIRALIRSKATRI